MILYEKEATLALRHPTAFLSINKNRIIKQIILKEIKNAQKQWNSYLSKEPTFELVLNRAKINWTVQQPLLYYAVRFTKPKTIVETGVNYGASSAMILQAIKDNGFGHLYSIDLPHAVYNIAYKENYKDIEIPNNESTGFAVPDDLRDNWSLTLGDAKTVLPKLLDGIGPIDFFFHDSEHTYEHMMFEYEQAFPRLTQGGILASDDIHLSTVFSDFCQKKKLTKIERIFKDTTKGFAFEKSLGNLQD